MVTFCDAHVQKSGERNGGCRAEKGEKFLI